MSQTAFLQSNFDDEGCNAQDDEPPHHSNPVLHLVFMETTKP